jgi:hypothetical protein
MLSACSVAWLAEVVAALAGPGDESRHLMGRWK